MRSSLVLDIETVSDENIPPELLQNLYDKIEVKADGRIKDEVKIQIDLNEKMEKAKENLRESFALSPLTGKICCVGYKLYGDLLHSTAGVTITEGTKTLCSKDEIEILENIQQVLDFTDQLTTFITFNGKSFDLPFLKVRAAIHGININFPRNDTKYNLDSHFDIRSALTNFDNYGKGTLSQWAMRFGIELPVEHTGNAIQVCYNGGDLEAISNICKSDVETTHQLYNKIKDFWR